MSPGDVDARIGRADDVAAGAPPRVVAEAAGARVAHRHGDHFEVALGVGTRRDGAPRRSAGRPGAPVARSAAARRRARSQASAPGWLATGDRGGRASRARGRRRRGRLGDPGRLGAADAVEAVFEQRVDEHPRGRRGDHHRGVADEGQRRPFRRAGAEPGRAVTGAVPRRSRSKRGRQVAHRQRQRQAAAQRLRCSWSSSRARSAMAATVGRGRARSRRRDHRPSRRFPC